MVSSKPKLLVLTSTYPRWEGDTEPAFVHELSKRLTHEFDVTVMCPHAPGAKTEEHLEQVQILRYRYAPTAWETLCQGGGIMANLKVARWRLLLLPLFFLGQFVATWRLIKQLKPTVIHVHWIIPQGLVLAILSHMIKLPPVLLTSHGGDLFGLRGRYMTKLKSWVLRRFSRLTVVSQPMVEPALKLGVQPAAVTVIPMGVDFQQRFKAFEGTRDSAHLLFVGRLVEKKGLSFLIDAMPSVLVAHPAAKLTVVGYGPEMPALQEKVNRLSLKDCVQFVGALPQAQLPVIYNSATLFIAPFVEASNGDLEGFPVALMEAVASGCPLIAGDIPVLRKAFGEYADLLLCDSRNTSILSDRIIAILDNPKSLDMAVANLRLKMASYLDWQVVSERYRQTLLSAMNEK